MYALLIGGIGLFLLGMMLMTEGLRSLAGDALRSVLERFVRGPLSGLAWGAGITALIQSSSATTLMTIGFVSAGLLSFSQSLGVIFGANIGTTSTGWIVSTIGLKLSMSAIALPLVGLGALVRLLGKERIAPLGTAIAGFGLLFIGIDTLQSGMETLATRIDPTSFPSPTLLGLPLLVLIGAVMTVVMQSSSAAVATTLAALHTQAITLDQAAVLVIGQNIGTSVKAILASIGASVPARRTAFAHTMFNVLTAAIALGLLPVFLAVMRAVMGDAANADTVSLAAFHTGFNIVGVAVMLPFAGAFARLVMRLVPETEPTMTRHLDPSVLEVPPVANEAVRRTLLEIAGRQCDVLAGRLRSGATRAVTLRRLAEIEHALGITQSFLSRLSAEASSEAVHARQVSALHATDHLLRLVRAIEHERSTAVIASHDDLRSLAERLLDTAPAVLADVMNAETDTRAAELGDVSALIANQRRRRRKQLLEETAVGKILPTESVKILEAYVWLDRVAYHLWRAAHHLGRAPAAALDPSDSNADEPRNGT